MSLTGTETTNTTPRFAHTGNPSVTCGFAYHRDFRGNQQQLNFIGGRYDSAIIASPHTAGSYGSTGRIHPLK